MPPSGVVAGTPAENIPTTLQLIGERPRVLENLALQSSVERLRQSIVSTAADRAHRLPDPQLCARVLERKRRVDTAVIRVKNCVLQTSTLALRHHQGVLDQGGTHVIGDREAGQPARETIDDGREVHIRPIGNRQVGDVADVDLVRCRGGEPPADEIREHRFFPFGHSGGDLAFLGVSDQLQGAHDPGDFLGVARGCSRVVVEFSGDAFRPVAATLPGEHGLDPCAENSVAEQAFVPGGGGVLPLVGRGPVEPQDLA